MINDHATSCMHDCATTTTHVLQSFIQALCKESGSVLQEWEATVKRETKDHADKVTIMKMRRTRERKEKMLQGRYYVHNRMK